MANETFNAFMVKYVNAVYKKPSEVNSDIMKPFPGPISVKCIINRLCE